MNALIRLAAAAMLSTLMVAPLSASRAKNPTNATPAAKTMTREEMQARIIWLEKKMKDLLKAYRWMRKAGVRRIARAEAIRQINNYMGKGGKRITISDSTGGIQITHLLVNNDNPKGVVIGSKPIRIAVAVKGKAFSGNAYVVVWALPVKSMNTLQNKYIIHSDRWVPYINGRAQTHFYWKGRYLNRSALPRGQYKVFAKVVVRNSKGQVAGSAMRFWGIHKSTTSYVVTRK